MLQPISTNRAIAQGKVIRRQAPKSKSSGHHPFDAQRAVPDFSPTARGSHEHGHFTEENHQTSTLSNLLGFSESFHMLNHKGIPMDRHVQRPSPTGAGSTVNEQYNAPFVAADTWRQWLLAQMPTLSESGIHDGFWFAIPMPLTIDKYHELAVPPKHVCSIPVMGMLWTICNHFLPR